MNRIYFADKGHTQQARCAPLWPAKDREFTEVPLDFFAAPGLVVYINPKLNDTTWFSAEITIYAAEDMLVEASSWDNVVRFRGRPCMAVTVGKDYISVSTHIMDAVDLRQRDPGRLAVLWRQREAALLLMQEAIELFTTYFPKQQ